MEVEAKFTIPDRDTLVRLREIVRLEDYVLGTPSCQEVHDRYLDTAARSLHGGGYACRLRSRGEQQMVTVKGLGGAESGVHRRVEIEFALPAGAGAERVPMDPQAWPAGEGRDLVRSLIGEMPLQDLFAVEQVRHVRPLHEGDRLVAEMSVDLVEVRSEGRQHTVRILEVELAPDGTMDDLQALIAHLTETWGLKPELHSKFDLGMALLDQPAVPSGGFHRRGPDQERLSALERVQLVRFADGTYSAHPDPAVQERARLILGWGTGTPVRELLAQLGRSRSWGYRWIARFRADRTSIFAALPSTEEGAPRIGKYTMRMEDGEEREATRPPCELVRLQEQMTVLEMCERFQVDMAHARCVAEGALALFDALAPIHRLSAGRRPLLEVMGILHNVGLETDPDRHHVVGRDIVLQHPLHELSSVEQHMLAAAIYLHRKRIKPRRLQAKVVSSLPPGTRSDALALAALLRIADGLDYSQGQTTAVDAIDVTPTSIQVSLCGPFAEVDAAQAEAKADLWEHLFGISIAFVLSEPERVGLASLEPGLGGPVSAGVQAASISPAGPAEAVRMTVFPQDRFLPDEAMSEAGRKVLSWHLARMLEHEPGTRAGEDIEELHDMRVATRRLRAAFGVFGPYFKASEIRPFVAGLRRTARTLGQVRDLDVLMEKAQAYLGSLPSENAHDLDPLLQAWQQRRDQARSEMIAYLDSDKYARFVQSFQDLLKVPGAGARKMKGFPPRATQVRHVVPRLVYARWEQVRAFGPLLPGAPIVVLHALRVECKRLRYALEFFREVLGPEVKEVIAQVVQLQDHLGNLHDADVANGLLSDFLFARQEGAPAERVIAPGVVAYLAVKQRELQTLIETFPQAWEAFNRPEIRLGLALSVAVL